MTALLPPVADAEIDFALQKSEALVAQATAKGLAFAFDELGYLDIPEQSTPPIDKAQLRALASLYLAAELEPAGVIPAAEKLAGLSSSVLQVDLGPARPLVGKFWQGRGDRPDASERNAFYARLFGTSSGPITAGVERNALFEDRMLTLCEALLKVAPGQGSDNFAVQHQVRLAGRKLMENLLQASTGITAFFAGEIIATLKQAVAILGHPHLRARFGARNIWDVIAAIGRLSAQEVRPPSPYIRRGKSGMTILAWLADRSDDMVGNSAIIRPGDAVIGAAVEWIEAVLEIGESSAGYQPGQGRGSGSAWAQLGS
ncbi:hypothetical protein ACI5KX_04990 [Erythrobacter sp. GH1-10]|uniref:hypothetical protein n=1 Tax=Erythrobacter sp. GH1-10 TaxID=3349334 RepID=UPI003877FBE4